MTTPHTHGSPPGSHVPTTPSDVYYSPTAPATREEQRGSQSEQHRGIRYPPLRFLSREQDPHGTESPTGGPSSPCQSPALAPAAAARRRSASTDDGSSDVSYSSADTAIFVAPDGRQTRMGPRETRPEVSDSEGSLARVGDSEYVTSQVPSHNGYRRDDLDFREPRTGFSSDGAVMTGYAYDNSNTRLPVSGQHGTTLDHFYQGPPHELSRVGNESGVPNGHILSDGHDDYRDALYNSPDNFPRCPDGRPFGHTSAQFEDSREHGPITSHTDHGPDMIGSRDKSLINTAPSTQTSGHRQSSSAATASFEGHDSGNYNSQGLHTGAYSGGENTSPTQRRAHPEPTARHDGLTGTSTCTQHRRTLPDDDDDFMRGEFNDYTDSRPGDLTSGNDRNVYTSPVSGKVGDDGISCEGTDLTGPLNDDPNFTGQRSVSYSSSQCEVDCGVGSDKDSLYGCQSPQSQYTAGTLIHPSENQAGNTPDHAVNSQVNMNGMYTKARDDENIEVHDQLAVDKSYDSFRNTSPNREMTMDNPLTYPVITNIQNENNSDTSSVDSDGVPYRKSALKTRQKKDGAQRTGRKVRFAEPIILNEPKTIGLSARERLGLVDKFTGGNRYVYVPSVGLKQMQDGEDQDQSATQTDIARKSVTFSPDTKHHDAGSPTPASTPNGPVIHQTGSNRVDHDRQTNHIGLSPDLAGQNNKNSQGIRFTDSGKNVHLGVNPAQQTTHDQNPSKDSEQFMQQNASSPIPNGLDHIEPEDKSQRAKIIRRPGIHVSRGKSALNQPVSSPNNPVSPIPPQSQGNTNQRLPKHRASSQSSLRTIHEIPRQSPTIAEGVHNPVQHQTAQRQEIPIMRHKVVKGAGQPTADSRVGRYFSESRLSSSSSSGEEADRSPGYVPPNAAANMRPNTHQPQSQHSHVRVGQQVLPAVDPSAAFSTSSSDNFRSDPRRINDSGSRLDNENYASYNGVTGPVSTTPKNNNKDRVPRLSTPSTEELAVLTPQGDTSSVPSPVSGDSGISSSSSLTDINRDPSADNLTDNYNTLNYIRKGKTQNVITRVDNLRQSQNRISPGPLANQMSPSEVRQQSGVVRRDSRNSDHRRRIVSDSSSTGGAIDQWTRATEYSPRDDSSVGYDSRTTSMTSTTSEMSQHGPRTSWSQAPNPDPRHPHGNHRGYGAHMAQPGNSQPNYYQDDPDPYGNFLRSATNRSSSKSKLVPIPLDILNPRSPGPGGYQNPDMTPQASRREHLSSVSSLQSGQPYANDDQSSLYSTSSVYNNYQGNNSMNGSPQDYGQQPRQPRYTQDHTPQYSSTADIYNLLKQKTRNPFR